MPDILEPPAPAAPKKRRKMTKRNGMAKSQGINVHVNVVTNTGEAEKKKMNEADSWLTRLRGY